MRFLSIIKYSFLLIFIFIFECCHSDINKNKKKEEVSEVSELSFQKKIHTFGNLKAGEIVVYSFSFKNTGRSNVIIERVKSSCGCITVNYPKHPIFPGKTEYIDVEYNSAGDLGKIYKDVVLYTSFNQEIKLVIMANVKNEILDINNLKN